MYITLQESVHLGHGDPTVAYTLTASRRQDRVEVVDECDIVSDQQAVTCLIP